MSNELKPLPILCKCGHPDRVHDWKDGCYVGGCGCPKFLDSVLREAVYAARQEGTR